jgi:hypothetical protein
MSATVKSQIEDYTADKSKQLRVALRELARENIELGEQVRTGEKLKLIVVLEYSLVEGLRKSLR